MPIGRRHYRITLLDALGAHEEALSYGGVEGIPSPDLVEAAIGRPYNGYYRPIASKTAALVHSMALNHGFADGNKRTSVILMHLLLSRSGYQLVPARTGPSLEKEVEDMVVGVVTKQIAFDGLVAWFKARIRRAE